MGAVMGVPMLFGPVLGPTLGGWLVQDASWRYIFFINIPVGLLAFFLVTRLIDDPPWIKPDRKLLRQRSGWPGVAPL